MRKKGKAMEKLLITCPGCGGESPSDARFCIECGESFTSATGPTTRLATPTCASCGAENLPEANFCALCGRSMPGASTAAQPWPQQHTGPRTRRRSVPVAAPRPVPAAPAYHPRPAAPPMQAAPQVARQSHRCGKQGSISPAGLVLLVGIVALVVMKAFTWPLFLLVGAAAILVHHAERGRLSQGLKVVGMGAAIALVAANPQIWPVLLIAFIFAKILGKGRRVW
jgi:hypothetical protein